jgi:hypothetical protein
MNYSEIHTSIVKTLSEMRGIEEVSQCFENPNKYGEVTSSISFKFNIINSYNYSQRRFGVSYKRKVVFIPDLGYLTLDEITPESVMDLLQSKLSLNKIIKQDEKELTEDQLAVKEAIEQYIDGVLVFDGQKIFVDGVLRYIYTSDVNEFLNYFEDQVNEPGVNFGLKHVRCDLDELFGVYDDTLLHCANIKDNLYIRRYF